MSSSTPEQQRIRYFDFAVPAAITLRAAGDCGGFDDAAVARRTELFSEYCGHTSIWSHAYHLPRQVHGKRVRILSPRAIRSSLRNTDGLISAHGGDSLAITVADCLPIYLAAPSKGVIALLHSGRRSTGILLRALAMLRRRYRVAADEVHLLFGPAIGSCCYAVGEDIAVRYRRRWGDETVIMRDGAYYIDLIRANERIAHTAGVFKIDIVDECTRCNDRYYSHRRGDTQAKQRMLAIISRRI